MSKPATVEALDEIFFNTEQLAARWHQRVETLQNQRSAGVGLPYLKLPTGAVLYRASDIIDAEINGMRGLSVDRMVKIVKECPLIDSRKAEAVAAYLREQLAKRA